MTQEEKRLKALGAAFRAVLKATEDMPPEIQTRMLRLLLCDVVERDAVEEQPVRKRMSA